MIVKQGSRLVDEVSGEVIASTVPKFSDYTSEEHYHKDVELDYIDCQCAKELDFDKLHKYINERVTVAEQKFDGHRGKLHITSKGNRLFSRNISKQTNWHTENTDQVPHIRDLKIDEFFYDTIIDGEVLLPVDNCDCRDVQGVTGALPETAIERQLEVGFAFLNAFDIIKYNGLDVTSLPYWKRKILLFHVVKAFNSEYINFCDMYTTEYNYSVLSKYYEALDKNLYTGRIYNEIASDFQSHIIRLPNTYDDLFSEFLQKGLEGLIIKDVSCRYEQKKCDNFIKMKAHLTFDCVIMGYEEPTREYNGKEIDTWQYWVVENDNGDDIKIYTDGEPSNHNKDTRVTPITKNYAMDWIGAIRFGVWKEVQLQYFIDEYGDSWEEALEQLKDEGFVRPNGKHHVMLVEVGKASGLDEATRQLISEDRDKYLGQVIEVEAQRIIDMETGSLQHPRFYRMRPDKNSEQCTFDEHIRK